MLPEACNIAIGSFGAGGAERICSTIINAWACKGRNIHLHILNGSIIHDGYRLHEGIRVHRHAHVAARTFFGTASRLLACDPKTPWLIFGHHVALPFIAASRLSKSPPIVVRCLNNIGVQGARSASFWHRLVKPLATRALLGQSNLVICQTESMAQDLQTQFAIAPERCRVIRNPIAPEFTANPTTSPPRDGPLLIVSRMTEQKDPLLALDALCQLQVAAPDCRVRWIGDGPMRNHVIDESRVRGLQSIITFETTTSDMPAAYDASRCLLLTSRYEGYPNVIAESLCRGRPVVATDCPHGPREMVSQQNGLLIRTRVPVDIASGLSKVMSTHWDHRTVSASYPRLDTAEQYWAAISEAIRCR